MEDRGIGLVSMKHKYEIISYLSTLNDPEG